MPSIWTYRISSIAGREGGVAGTGYFLSLFLALAGKATKSKTAATTVVIPWVDVGRVEVEAARIGSRVHRARPVVAAATTIAQATLAGITIRAVGAGAEERNRIILW